jgi:hypothetical protein
MDDLKYGTSPEHVDQTFFSNFFNSILSIPPFHHNSWFFSAFSIFILLSKMLLFDITLSSGEGTSCRWSGFVGRSWSD